MDDNVIPFTGITRNSLQVERVMDEASAATDGVFVGIGWDADGEFYFASSVADGADVLWLLEKAKQKLLAVDIPQRSKR